MWFFGQRIRINKTRQPAGPKSSAGCILSLIKDFSVHWSAASIIFSPLAKKKNIYFAQISMKTLFPWAFFSILSYSISYIDFALFIEKTIYIVQQK